MSEYLYLLPAIALASPNPSTAIVPQGFYGNQLPGSHPGYILTALPSAFGNLATTAFGFSVLQGGEISQNTAAALTCAPVVDADAAPRWLIADYFKHPVSEANSPFAHTGQTQFGYTSAVGS